MCTFYSFPFQNSHEAKACSKSISSPLTTVAPIALPFFRKMSLLKSRKRSEST